jgi:hypothetical protein
MRRSTLFTLLTVLSGCGLVRDEQSLSQLAPQPSAPEAEATRETVREVMQPPPAPKVRTKSQLCPSLVTQSATQVIVYGIDGGYGEAQNLWFLDASNNLRKVGTFGADRKAIYIAGIGVQATGAYILAERVQDGAMLFDREGALLERTNDQDGTRAMLLRRKLFDLYPGVINASIWGTDYNVVGPQTEGRVPVQRFSSAGKRETGWLDTDNLAVTLLPDLEGFGIVRNELQYIDGAFIGIGKQAGTFMLMRFTPSSAPEQLPIGSGAADLNVRIQEQSGGWVVVGDYAENQWIANPRQRAIRKATAVAPPAGYSHFDGNPLTFAGPSQLAGITTFRTPLAAAAFILDGTGVGKQVGPLMTDVNNTRLQGAQGTYVVAGLTYGPMLTWQKPAPAGSVSGAQQHLVRPAANVTVTLGTGATVHLTPDGLCALTQGYVAEGTPAITVWDMQTGKSEWTEVLSSKQSFKWLP